MSIREKGPRGPSGDGTSQSKRCKDEDRLLCAINYMIVDNLNIQIFDAN